MPRKPSVETMSVSQFKATCLAALERVRRTGRPILITKRGQLLAEVIPPPSSALGTDWIGSLADSARITGDIVSSAPGARARRNRRSVGQEVTHILESAVAPPDQSLLDLKALGKEHWHGIDARRHVRGERDAWD